MARQTTNYGLTKPDYTDTADIEVVNANMDIIDGALKVIDTKSNNVMSKNSSAWSSTVAYAVGQYCIYNNSLWKCLVQHSGQTPQEGTYWARVSLDTLGSEINALNRNLDISEHITLKNGVTLTGSCVRCGIVFISIIIPANPTNLMELFTIDEGKYKPHFEVQEVTRRGASGYGVAYLQTNGVGTYYKTADISATQKCTIIYPMA